MKFFATFKLKPFEFQRQASLVSKLSDPMPKNFEINHPKIQHPFQRFDNRSSERLICLKKRKKSATKSLSKIFYCEILKNL